MILKFVTELLVKRKLNNTENKRLKVCNLESYVHFFFIAIFSLGHRTGLMFLTGLKNWKKHSRPRSKLHYRTSECY